MAENDETPEVPRLYVTDSGTIVVDGIVIGRFDGVPGREPFVDEPRIVLDLGWLKAAGVHIRLVGDRDVDKRRVTLER